MLFCLFLYFHGVSSLLCRRPVFAVRFPSGRRVLGFGLVSASFSLRRSSWSILLSALKAFVFVRRSSFSFSGSDLPTLDFRFQLQGLGAGRLVCLVFMPGPRAGGSDFAAAIFLGSGSYPDWWFCAPPGLVLPAELFVSRPVSRSIISVLPLVSQD
jgi:hypothetical protein